MHGQAAGFSLRPAILFNAPSLRLKAAAEADVGLSLSFMAGYLGAFDNYYTSSNSGNKASIDMAIKPCF